MQLVRRAIDHEGDPVGPAEDVLPEGWSARTRVHEYGGGAWWLGGPHHPDTVFFANWDDQRLYRFIVGESAPVAVTSEPATKHALRFADGVVTPDGRWIVCVRESHDDTWPEARNEIVAIPASLGGDHDQPVLVSGPDFVSNPRMKPNGTMLCWIEWDHPNMPWDETRLRVGELAFAGPSGAPSLNRVVTVTEPAVAGDEGTFEPGRSWLQPQWVDGADQLWVITDPRVTRPEDEVGIDDRWVLRGYRRVSTSQQSFSAESRWTAVDGVPSGGYETGSPQWVFGQSDYCIVWSSDRAVSTRPHGLVRGYLVFHHGADALGSFDVGLFRRVDLPFSMISGLTAVADRPAMIVASFTTEAEIVLGVGDTMSTIRPARDLGVDESWFSVPRHIEFPTTSYDDGSPAVAHALYYPPLNPDHHGPPEEKPPLLVLSHGGPTGAARSQLQLSVQYWTSRGIAVVDVNYRGSTGYGRAYRDALRGKWGIYDVDDCIAAAQFLVEEGEVDPDRLIIRGGSAGGFTTLAALTFHDIFAAGASRYGIADLVALARDTHKFESRYLDSLVGRWPEDDAIYDERSPINHTERLRTPLIILQGTEDEVVPPAQAEMMVAALREKGIPFAYLLFEGEQHGFRQASNIKRAIEAELYFLSRMLGFDPADSIEPVEIEQP